MSIKDKIFDIVHAEQICAIDSETMRKQLYSLLLEEVSKAFDAGEKNEWQRNNLINAKYPNKEQYMQQLNEE